MIYYAFVYDEDGMPSNHVEINALNDKDAIKNTKRIILFGEFSRTTKISKNTTIVEQPSEIIVSRGEHYDIICTIHVNHRTYVKPSIISVKE